MGCVPTHVSVVGRFKAVVTEVAEFDTVGKYGFKLSWDFPFEFFFSLLPSFMPLVCWV